MSERFAVLDIETTWADELMSIGVVIADSSSYEVIDKRYYIILPNRDFGGMYSSALYINAIRPDLECVRQVAINKIKQFLLDHGVKKIFAYNALFDYGHLPELRQFNWFDIMRIAAYKQYNKKIPRDADCYDTGRLKRGYGVENMYRLMSGKACYCETHNGLFDAIDELKIMKMLGLALDEFAIASING